MRILILVVLDVIVFFTGGGETSPAFWINTAFRLLDIVVGSNRFLLNSELLA